MTHYSDDRLSLAQEIADCLRARGYWTPKDQASADLIHAVGLALDGGRAESAESAESAENELLKGLLDQARRYLAEHDAAEDAGDHVLAIARMVDLRAVIHHAGLPSVAR